MSVPSTHQTVEKAGVKITVLSPATLEKIKKAMTRFPKPLSAVLPALHAVYEQFGYLDEPKYGAIAEVLGVNQAEVAEAATFYTLFPKQPVGKNLIIVCKNISCALRGADNLISYLKKKLGIKVFAHENNLGYGGNQKTCYEEALKENPDVVVMLHPDYQYDAKLIEELIRPILEGRFDFMFGSRIQNRETALLGGMPKLKYYINRIVCLFENILIGVNFTEHFSGFRAYSVKLLKEIPFQRFSNDFVFDQQMTISALSFGYRIGEIPIPTRYHEKASSIQFIKGTKYILETFWTVISYKLHKNRIIKSSIFS